MGELLRNCRVVRRRADRLAVRRHDSDRGQASGQKLGDQQRIWNAECYSFFGRAIAVSARQRTMAWDRCGRSSLRFGGLEWFNICRHRGSAPAEPAGIPSCVRGLVISCSAALRGVRSADCFGTYRFLTSPAKLSSRLERRRCCCCSSASTTLGTPSLITCLRESHERRDFGKGIPETGKIICDLGHLCH